jgi:hypothetical protein
MLEGDHAFGIVVPKRDRLVDQVKATELASGVEEVEMSGRPTSRDSDPRLALLGSPGDVHVGRTTCSVRRASGDGAYKMAR